MMLKVGNFLKFKFSNNPIVGSKEGDAYYNNLDTLRFIAAFLVIAYHWGLNVLVRQGSIGVNIFFTLSGFLITEILIKNKLKINANKITFKNAITGFYIRRSLRIFPLYFFIVAIVYTLHDPILSGRFYYVALFMTNILIDKLNGVYPPLYSCLWTLAVEEQFYLFWPMLIFLIRKDFLIPAIITVIVISMISILTPISVTGCNTICNMRYLGIGAFVAAIKNLRPEYFPILTKANSYLLPLSALIFVCLQIIYIFYHKIFQISGFDFIVHLVINFCSYTVLVAFITCKNVTINKVLQNPVTSYLGRISYGLYIYNVFIPIISRSLSGIETKHLIHFPFKMPVINGVSLFALNMILLVVISSISWYFFEKPINNLKRYFSH